MKCTNCGREIGAGAIFCTGCGMRVSDMKNDSAENMQTQQEQAARQGEQPQYEQTPQQQEQAQQSGGQSQWQNHQFQSSANQGFNGINNYGYNPNASMNMGYNPNMGMGMAVNQVPIYNTYIDDNGKSVPIEYKPIKAWGYFGYNILFVIPLVGFIFLLIYALGGTSNVNLKNYARSFFCVYALALIILLVVCVFAIILGVSTS